MATSSSTKLTKYESAVTIVTADVANSWFGGLYGTSAGNNKEETDPMVAGHKHDGSHEDGHAQKIHLVDHVTNQLRNVNLADDAVTKRTVASFTAQNQAIPETEVVDGVTFYYLDLTAVYSAITDVTPSFGTVDVVTGAGTVSLVADQANDTLTVKAGAGITLTAVAGSDEFTITGSDVSNAFAEIAQAAVNGGAGTGANIVADAVSDVVTFRADDGIDLVNDPANDRITIKNIGQSFKTITVTAVETGTVTGTVPIVADAFEDTLDFEIGHGMTAVGTAASDKIKFQSLFSTIHGIVCPNDTQGNWGSTVTRVAGTSPNDDIGYNYLVVNANANGIYFWVPMPKNAIGNNPTKVNIKAYFNATDVTGTGFLAANTPTFAVRLRYGSNSTQNDVGEINEIGTIANNASIISGATQLWADDETKTSSAVTATEFLQVIEWAENTLQVSQNATGLMLFKIIGITGFGAADAFDGDDARAALHFIGADYAWQY